MILVGFKFEGCRGDRPPYVPMSRPVTNRIIEPLDVPLRDGYLARRYRSVVRWGGVRGAQIRRAQKILEIRSSRALLDALVQRWDGACQVLLAYYL